MPGIPYSSLMLYVGLVGRKPVWRGNWKVPVLSPALSKVNCTLSSAYSWICCVSSFHFQRRDL